MSTRDSGRGDEPSTAMDAWQDAGAEDAAVTAQTSGATHCQAAWSASKDLNLGPLGMTNEYPPWIVPLIAVDARGELILGVNAYQTSLAAGLSASVEYSAVLAKLDGDCQPVWTRHVSDPSGVRLVTLGSVATDSQSNIVLAGWFNGALDFGEGAVAESGTATAIFISKLDPGGVHLWTRVLATGSSIAEVRVGPGDDLILSGTAYSEANLGEGPLCPANALRDRSAGTSSWCHYMIKFDRAGEQLWMRAQGESGWRNMALLDAEGSVLTTRSEVPAIGTQRSLLHKLGASGEATWTLDIGSAFDVPIRVGQARKERLLALDHDGAILHLEPYVSQADEDRSADDSNFYGLLFEPHRAWLSSVSAGGEPSWTRPVADFDGGRAGAIAIDAQGNPLLAGEFSGEVQFGSALLKGRGERDVFVTKLDTMGQELWSARVGGDGGDWAGDIAAAPGGGVWVTGWTGTIILSPIGSIYDNLHRSGIFVAKLVP